MADSKKYNGSTWEHSLRKLTTATDTLITLPVDVYADGNSATVGISGNTVQNGTPTPDNPIQPQGCGDLETVGAKAGQYKIPISSGQQTTNIYLGSTQTVRKIAKYVFTGQENFEIQSVNSYGIVNFRSDANVLPSRLSGEGNCICSHFELQTSNISAETEQGFRVISGTRLYFRIFETDISTVAGLQAWLAAQYAAGTPVTVWYVLGTPETGIANEPLMKIGDYADTVSGITVPTITGKDTFDVETTLKPSEASISYTGWHNATVKERDGSQWNE